MLTAYEPRAFRRSDTKLALRELASFFYRQRLFIIVTTLAVSCASISLSYLIPPVYTASGSIVVERNHNPLLRNQFERPGAAVEMANDVASVMTSRPVIEAVVDQLRPHERPRRPSALRDGVEEILATLDRWGMLTVLSRREKYIRRWSKALMVDGSGDYVTVSLSEEDAALGAAAVNAIINEYLRHYLDLFRMRRELELRREIFAQTQSAIAAHRRSILESAAQQPLPLPAVPGQNAAQSGSPGAVAVDLERNLRDWLTARAKSELAAKVPAARLLSSAGFDNLAEQNTILDQLRIVRRSLDAVDAKVRALQMEFGPEHPETVLAQETQTALREAAADLEAELRRIGARKAAAEEAQAVKEAFSTRLDATRRQVDLIRLYTQTDTRATSVRLAELAEIPSMPDVMRLLQVSFGIVASAVFALGAALIRDRANLRIHTPEGIEAILKSPVLLVMPNNSSQAMRLRR